MLFSMFKRDDGKVVKLFSTQSEYQITDENKCQYFVNKQNEKRDFQSEKLKWISTTEIQFDYVSLAIKFG